MYCTHFSSQHNLCLDNIIIIIIIIIIIKQENNEWRIVKD